MPPAEILDTLTGVGAPVEPIAADSTVALKVTVLRSLPHDEVAVTLTVAAQNAGAIGWVSVYGNADVAHSRRVMWAQSQV